jgi:hypothetical protein
MLFAYGLVIPFWLRWIVEEAKRKVVVKQKRPPKRSGLVVGAPRLRRERRWKTLVWGQGECGEPGPHQGVISSRGDTRGCGDCIGPTALGPRWFGTVRGASTGMVGLTMGTVRRDL